MFALVHKHKDFGGKEGVGLGCGAGAAAGTAGKVLFLNLDDGYMGICLITSH